MAGTTVDAIVDCVDLRQVIATSLSDAALRDIVRAFAGAVMSGDLDAVRALLHPDTVVTGDGGPHRRAVRRPVVGPDRVARFVVNVLRRLPEGGEVEPLRVNGTPGMLVSVDGRPFLVHAVEVRDGRVARQYLVLNPDKLAAVGRGVGLS